MFGRPVTKLHRAERKNRRISALRFAHRRVRRETHSADRDALMTFVGQLPASAKFSTVQRAKLTADVVSAWGSRGSDASAVRAKQPQHPGSAGRAGLD